MKPISEEPIFRLLIELLGIPTTPEDKFKVCGAEPYLTVADRVKEVLTPQIVDASPEEEAQSGGRKIKRRSRSRRKSRKSKK